MIFNLFQLLLLASLTIQDDQKGNWCYDMDSEKPCSQLSSDNDWHTGTCGSGKKQSGINIRRAKVEVFNGDGITLPNPTGYIFKQIKVSPTGSITPEPDESHSFSWPSKDTTYLLHQIHFHWGAVNGKGSEHAIDGQTYSMEVHFVHFDKKHETFETALASGDYDALAVIGVFFKVDPSAPESLLTPVTKGLTSGEEFNWNAQTILKNQFRAYHYNGSLTNPPCPEVIAWVVCKVPILISPEDVKVFRESKGGESRYRTLQKSEWIGTPRLIERIPITHTF